MIQLDFSPFPDLLTDRLHLRSFEEKDSKTVFALRSNPIVAEYLDRPLLQQEADARAYINKMIKGVQENQWIIWAISVKDGPMIGSICLWNIVAEEAQAEIGYELLPHFQGRGFMQEAVATVLGYGFQQMHLHKIRAILDKRNQSSLRLLEKYGFVQDKTYNDKEETLISYMLNDEIIDLNWPKNR